MHTQIQATSTFWSDRKHAMRQNVNIRERVIREQNAVEFVHEKSVN